MGGGAPGASPSGSATANYRCSGVARGSTGKRANDAGEQAIDQRGISMRGGIWRDGNFFGGKGIWAEKLAWTVCIIILTAMKRPLEVKGNDLFH